MVMSSQGNVIQFFFGTQGQSISDFFKMVCYLMLCEELADLTFGHLSQSQDTHDVKPNYGSKVQQTFW